MNTCVSLNCPFMDECKHYNFLIDRGNKCEHAIKIIQASEYYRERTKINQIITCLKNEKSIVNKLFSKNPDCVPIQFDNIANAIHIYFNQNTRNTFQKLIDDYMFKYKIIDDYYFETSTYLDFKTNKSYPVKLLTLYVTPSYRFHDDAVTILESQPQSTKINTN